MADNFSLDDILAEIDAKKATKSDSPDSESSASKSGYSVTSIIGGGDEISRAIGSKKKAGKPSGIGVSTAVESSEPKTEPKKREASPNAAAPAAPKQPEPAPVSHAPAAPKAEPKPAPKKEQIKEKTEAREKTLEAQKAKEKSKSDFLASIARKLTDAPEDEVSEAKAEPKKAEPKPTKRREYNTEQRELINRQLKAEESFENPDELIDAINPFEVKSKAADMEAALGGDTLGIAGNELKKLAEAGAKSNKKSKPRLVDKTTKIDMSANVKTAENPIAGSAPLSDVLPSEYPDGDMKVFSSEPTIETTAPVKKYIPQKEQQAAAAPKLSEKERRSNDALLTKLNQALSKKHEDEAKKRQTQGLSEETGNALFTPTGGLNLDGQKIIMATGVIPDSEIKEKSKRKLRDFVMDSDEDEREEEEDFDSYDSTGQIWADLCESHKVIKIRLLLLLIIAVFMSFVALMGDLGNDMVFKFFGSSVTFLDRRADVQGFLFYSLITGVITAILCSSVISNGLIKLFKLKADCDSVCAVTMLTAVITTAINITNSDSVFTSQAYVLIPTAIAGLMFNTLGKLMMIRRAKRNFRFISGDSAKYSAYSINSQSAYSLTKGAVNEVPCLAAMRKTELLTDFLKSSYCEDRADKISKKLVPSALGAALLIAAVSFVIPYSADGLQYNVFRALTAFTAVLSAATPFSMMFTVNLPLSRAGVAMAKTESVILGYQAAEDFSAVNSVMTDASLLFPAGTIIYSNIKHCKQPNSVNNIALDQAIILAASLAIQSGSVMSNMFKNMINDKEEILVKVENCVYEDNLGVLGWYGTRRMIMGSRDQMKRHDIKVPEMKKISKYAKDYTETIYLSVGGEVVIMFFVELLPNPEVKNALHELTDNGVSVVVKTTDSIITVSKIAEVFEIPPEMIKILPYSLHEQFHAFTRYVSRGSGAVSCNGTFTGFSKAVISAKRLMKDISLGMWIMLIGVILGVVFAAAAVMTGNTYLICPSMISGWNLAWLLLTVIGESIRRY